MLGLCCASSCQSSVTFQHSSKHALDASSAFCRGIVASYKALPHKVMLQLGGRRSCPGAVSLVPLVRDARVQLKPSRSLLTESE